MAEDLDFYQFQVRTHAEKQPFAFLCSSAFTALDCVPSDDIYVKGRDFKETICQAALQVNEEEGIILLSESIKQETGVSDGDFVRVYPRYQVKVGEKLTVFAASFDFENLEKSAVLEQITDAVMFQPVRENETFEVSSALGPVQCKVTQTQPSKCVHVNWSTQITLLLGRPESKIVEVWVKGLDGLKRKLELERPATAMDVKRKLGAEKAKAALAFGQRICEDDNERISAYLTSEQVIRLIPRYDITIISLSGSRTSLSVLGSQPVSTVLPIVRGESTESITLYCEHTQLEPHLSYQFQGVHDGAEIYGKMQITLTCTTISGNVQRTFCDSDSVQKLKLEFSLAAHLDVTAEYLLFLSGTPLSDTDTIGSSGITSASELRLEGIPAEHEEEVRTTPQLPSLLAGAFSGLVPGVTAIPTRATTETLKLRGFQPKHILDPFQYYKMMLVHGREEDEGELSGLITIKVEVDSWGAVDFDLSPQVTIKELKQHIESSLKIQEMEQTLIYSGQTLTDSATLAASGIGEGSSITLVCGGPNAYLLIPLDRFDDVGDFDYTRYTTPPDFGKRGGHIYKPPAGWMRYGLKVTGVFESDVWLGMCNGPGEWIVSYHGTSTRAIQSIAQTGYDLDKCYTFYYGRGVYSAPDIADAEGYASLFEWEGRCYKIAFMNRVNPDTNVLLKTREKGEKYPDYYVSKTDRDIRPYGILIKSL